MARTVRIEYEGAVYHVLSRGNRREDIFRSDGDRISFLDTLEETCERTGFLVHSYVLMPNHYHLLLETPEANLVEGMRWLQGTYTMRFNRRNQLVGHVFQGRYKAIPIEAGNGDAFRTVSDYIHLNPARAGLLRAGNGILSSYPWSSYPSFVEMRGLPFWLVRSRVFAAVGLDGDGATNCRRFRAYLERRAIEAQREPVSPEMEAEWNDLRHRWFLGGDEFRDRLEDLAEKRVRGGKRVSYDGAALTRHDERIAEQWLQIALQAMGYDRRRLAALRPSDPHKQAVAWLLRSRTTVRAEWLSQHIEMGHASNVSRAVAAFRSPSDAQRRKLKRELLQACKDPGRP